MKLTWADEKDQKVTMTADAFPGEIFTGVVRIIPPSGVVVMNIVTYNVKIEVTSENKSLLLSQMTTNVKIIEAEKTNVLTVPFQAIGARATRPSSPWLKTAAATKMSR